MSSNNPTGVLPSTSYDFYYPTILLTLEVSELAYETYSSSGSLVSSKPTDPSESTLLAAGWTQIQGLLGQDNSADNYQGVAFYKVVDGVTEIVIGNRGSQSPYDFAVSDAAIAANAVPDADACVSYGAEGTIATFLLAGVPQLISPWHVEAHMASRRIEALGAATVLRDAQDAQSISRALAHLCTDGQLKQCARAFSLRHRNSDFNRIAQQVAEIVEATPKAGLTSREGALSCA